MPHDHDMSASEILAQLNLLDEASRFEAKEGQDIDKSARETICAFCNEPDLGGGYLILGLRRTQMLFDTQYTVVGVEDPDKLQCNLATQCSDLFSTVIRPDIHVEELEGERVVWAYIPEVPAGEKPVYIKSSGKAYRRIGATDHVCTQDDLDVFYQLRAGRAYDETPIHDGDMRDFSPEAIAEYRRLRGRANAQAWELTASDEDLLRSLRCIIHEDGRPLPTVAGVQLFGTQAALRRCFPMSRIDYIRITGTQWIQDPEKRFDTVEIRDSLFSAIRRTEAAILDDLPKAFSLPEGSLERTDIPRLPAMVIREAVVNAVMHRNYRTHSPIQIIRYSNRLEIRNPGHSLKPEEQLGEPGSNPRNPAIAAVLHETHLAETKGSGIKVMRDLMDRANLEPPTFKSSRAADEFVAIFLFHHFLTEESLRWLNGLADHNLTQEDRKALVYARETEFIDNAAYRDINQVDTLTASAHLRHLRDEGLLKMEGIGAKTYYVLSSSLLKPDKLAGKPDNLQAKPDNLPDEPVDLLAVPELLSQMPKKLRDTVLAVGKKAPKEILRHTILGLCRWRELTAAQLAGILRRNKTFLMGEHLKPMVEAGDLRMKYPQENHPQQAYSCMVGDDKRQSE